MKKVIFVSHCILNTASKVVLYNQQSIDAEEKLRLQFVSTALNNGIQIVQLPCPEFTLYGSKRWGHVSDQFDNPFFREHCRKILTTIIQQLKEYLSNSSYEVLGIVGIDGSPSCGVDYTCQGDWYGSFEGRTDLQEVLRNTKLVNKRGIFMEGLDEMLKEENLNDKVIVRSLYAREPDKCLDLIR